MRRIDPDDPIDLDPRHHRPAHTGRPRAGRRARGRTLAVLVALVLALAACSSGAGGDRAPDATARSTGPPAAGPAAAPGRVRVVVLGSSTAAGFGLADPTDGWVARYTAALERSDPGSEVVNLAVAGFSTFQVLPTGTPTVEGRPAVDPDHNITAALARKPDAVIVNLPSNDAAMGVPTDEQMANLATVAAAAEKAHVPLWVGTTQPRNLDGAGRALLVEARNRILAVYGDRAVDLWTGIATAGGAIEPDLDSGDGIHLDPSGHAILAERFLAADIPKVVARG